MGGMNMVFSCTSLNDVPSLLLVQPGVGAWLAGGMFWILYQDADVSKRVLSLGPAGRGYESPHGSQWEFLSSDTRHRNRKYTACICILECTEETFASNASSPCWKCEASWQLVFCNPDQQDSKVPYLYVHPDTRFKKPPCHHVWTSSLHQQD